MNDRMTVTIESIAYGGKGIARYDGMVYFVPDVLPGEVVQVRITKKKKNYCEAVVETIVMPSQKRIDSPCVYSVQCGGCAYLHIPYEEQLAIKRQQVADTIARIGAMPDTPIADIVPSPAVFNYRNRITLHTRKACRDTMGFFARDNITIIPITECKLAAHILNNELLSLSSYCNERSADIILTQDDTHIACLSTKQHSAVAQHLWHHAHDPDATKTTSRYEPVHRSSFYLNFTYNDKTISYTPQCFFQTNTGMLKKLCATIETILQIPEKTLIDLYCGVGIFSLLLADRYTSVIGIEENKHAVSMAQHNAKHNNTLNTKFIAARAEKALAKYLSPHARTCDLLIDPPRVGLSDDVKDVIKKNPPKHIIYISCNPTTCARDLAALREHYTVTQIIPFDMFPQTYHIEMLCVLERK